MTILVREQIKVADEVWVVTALLHREQPNQPDFSIEEIIQRAQEESLCENFRKGLYVHVVQHCVANRAPNPGRYRMLYETVRGRRRLFRKGDSYHPAREGAKIMPEIENVPPQYRNLVAWYRDWSAATSERTGAKDPLKIMREISKGMWAEENPDEYVRRLREGWE